ncbi:hypothetical protein [Microbispora sp. CA-102843]|uniref:hypothetical protein n=1 Tax=Microbispora sp. CA-102843 TaxID=3239952 RepID=UPI003D906843
MADEFVDARRKDDHSVTQRVAVSALPYFPDWEPIPTGDEKDPAQTSEGDDAKREADETGDSKPKTTKSTSKATDSKGRE